MYMDYYYKYIEYKNKYNFLKSIIKKSFQNEMIGGTQLDQVSSIKDIPIHKNQADSILKHLKDPLKNNMILSPTSGRCTIYSKTKTIKISINDTTERCIMKGLEELDIVIDKHNLLFNTMDIIINHISSDDYHRVHVPISGFIIYREKVSDNKTNIWMYNQLFGLFIVSIVSDKPIQLLKLKAEHVIDDTYVSNVLFNSSMYTDMIDREQDKENKELQENNIVSTSVYAANSYVGGGARNNIIKCNAGELLAIVESTEGTVIVLIPHKLIEWVDVDKVYACQYLGIIR